MNIARTETSMTDIKKNGNKYNDQGGDSLLQPPNTECLGACKLNLQPAN